MAITTLTSRELNQDIGKAKKAAADGPVFITDRGKPAHVMLTIDEFRRLSGQRQNILDALRMPKLSEIDFEPPKLEIRSRDSDLG